MSKHSCPLRTKRRCTIKPREPRIQPPHTAGSPLRLSQPPHRVEDVSCKRLGLQAETVMTHRLSLVGHDVQRKPRSTSRSLTAQASVAPISKPLASLIMQSSPVLLSDLMHLHERSPRRSPRRTLGSALAARMFTLPRPVAGALPIAPGSAAAQLHRSWPRVPSSPLQLAGREMQRSKASHRQAPSSRSRHRWAVHLPVLAIEPLPRQRWAVPETQLSRVLPVLSNHRAHGTHSREVIRPASMLRESLVAGGAAERSTLTLTRYGFHSSCHARARAQA